MKDHCSLQLLFTYKCNRMWSKVHFFFCGFCSQHAPQEARKKVWFMKWLGMNSNRKSAWHFLQAFTLPGMPWNISIGCCFTALFFFLLSSLPRIPSPSLFDVLCPDRLHMEAKEDTHGLIRPRQRHAKAIWAPKANVRFSASPPIWEEEEEEEKKEGKKERKRWKV